MRRIYLYLSACRWSRRPRSPGYTDSRTAGRCRRTHTARCSHRCWLCYSPAALPDTGNRHLTERKHDNLGIVMDRYQTGIILCVKFKAGSRSFQKCGHTIVHIIVYIKTKSPHAPGRSLSPSIMPRQVPPFCFLMWLLGL